MKKTIKKISAVLTAVMCSSVIMTSSVSAAEYSVVEDVSALTETYAKKQDEGYEEAVRLVGVKYDSSLAKEVEGYMNKTSKTKVTYKESLTNKIVSKISDKWYSFDFSEKDAFKKGLSYSEVGKNSVRYYGYRGDKSVVIEVEEYYHESYGIYVDSKNSTYIDLATKEKETRPATQGEMAQMLGSNFYNPVCQYKFDDGTLGDVFQFKFKKNSYTFEVFDPSEYEKYGFLFDSKGTLIGIYIDTKDDSYDRYVSVKASLSPKSSELEVPSGYKKDEAHIRKMKEGYEEAARVVGVKYDSSLEKQTKSYMNKTSKTKITYKKSRTYTVYSKMMERLEAIAAGDKEAIKNGLSYAEVGKDTIYYHGCKGGRIAIIDVTNTIRSGNKGMYIDSKDVLTYTDFDDKIKWTIPRDKGYRDIYIDTIRYRSAHLLEDDVNGNVFEFNFKNSSYTFEVFELSELRKIGFLFDSKGNLIGICCESNHDDYYDEYVTVKISFSPKSSDLEVPSGYKETDEPFYMNI